MSNFPFPWWDSTITIYNKYIDPTNQRVSWYKNTVTDCFWKCTNNIYNMGRYGMTSLGVRVETKEIVCRIPESSKFVPKEIWETLSDGERSEYFTLANGDIIILGDVEDTIDEYTSGKHSTDLITKYKRYDKCVEIDTYIDNVRNGVGLKHYHIVGK